LLGVSCNSLCSDNYGCTVYADWLFFKVSGDELDVLSVSQGVSNTPNEPRVTVDNWSRIDVCPNYDSGYRVGLIKDMRCASIFGEWTSYSTDKRTSFHFDGPSSSSEPFAFTSDFINTNTTAHKSFDFESDFRFSYNRLDVGSKKKIINTCDFSLSPTVAFTYLHTREDLSADATSFFVDPEPGNTSQINTFDGKTKYDGFGATVGCNCLWQFIKCFALYVDASASLTYGCNDVQYSFNRFNDQFVPFDNTYNFSYDKWKSLYINTFKIGLRSETEICNQYHVYGMIGWEYVVFYDQTNWMVKQTMNFPESFKPSGNLYLQGLVLRGGINF